jgi:hypothetical protein
MTNLNCPQCNYSVHVFVAEGKTTNITCPNCFSHFGYDSKKRAYINYSFGSSEGSEIDWKRTLKIVAGCIIALFCCINGCSYNNQRMLRNQILDQRQWQLFGDYAIKYPNGYFMEELKVISDTVQYQEALKKQQFCCDIIPNNVDLVNSGSLSNPCPCEYMSEYIKNQPNGLKKNEAPQDYRNCLYQNIMHQHTTITDMIAFMNSETSSNRMDSVLVAYNRKWDNVIQVYDKTAKENKAAATPKAFFVDLLKYLKTNRKTTIYIDFQKTVKLKEWDEFSIEARKLLAEFVKKEPGNNKNPSLMDVEPVSIQGYFSDSKIRAQEMEVLSTLQSQLEAVLGNDITLVETDSPPANEPLIRANYRIQNKILTNIIFFGDIPTVYVLTQKEVSPRYSETKTSFMNYLMGVNVNWNFSCMIPGSKPAFQFNTTTNPQDAIDGFDDTDGAYKKMLQLPFDNFSTKISTTFGLDHATQQNQ